MNMIVFGPHPDDQEIGMGGTIALLADQGHDVLVADVTDGSPTPRGERAGRLVEAREALAHLQPTPARAQAGARPVRRVLLDLPNRGVMHSLESRHRFAGLIRAHQAQILFIPYWEDAHPDHVATTRIAEDARFDAKLTKVDMPTPPGYQGIGPPIYPKWVFYYDVSHLRTVAKPDFIIDITGYVERKEAAIRAYRSQFGPWDDESSGASFAPGDSKARDSSPGVDSGRLVRPDFPARMLEFARYMGSRIGAAYGEGFWTREPLGLSGLHGLIM